MRPLFSKSRLWRFSHQPLCQPKRRTVMVASTAVQNSQPSPVDLGALKTRQQGAWSSGDYAVVGTTLQIVGEAAVRSPRPPRRTEGARRRGRQRQRHARRGSPLVRRGIHRLCAEPARARPAARRGGRSVDRVQGGGRRGAALRRRQFRRGGLDLRRHVHAGSGQGRGGTAQGMPERRQDRPRQLDAGRFYRAAVQDARKIPAAAGRCEVARHCGGPGRALRKCSGLQRW